jgi:hypothetical protein
MPVSGEDRHREIEKPEPDAFAITDASRELDDLLVKWHGCIEIVLRAMELRHCIERGDEVVLILLLAGKLERFFEVRARGGEVPRQAMPSGCSAAAIRLLSPSFRAMARLSSRCACASA